MKIKVLHRVFSFLLSLLVMISTVSITIEKHFCGDTLVDIAFFSESKKCGMEMKAMSSENEVKKKSCCKDEIDVIEGQDDIASNSIDDLVDFQKQVLYAYTFSYISLFESLPRATIPNKDYSPPILIKDIHVLDETYLI